MLVNRDRQGHHHISLVPQKVFMKAVDHQHKGHNTNARDCQRERDQQQHAQGIQRAVVCLQQAAGGKIGAHGGNQHQQKHGQHHAARGTELMLHQFSQHLNTSRNSASTLIPFSSRIWSTEVWSTTRP